MRHDPTERHQDNNEDLCALLARDVCCSTHLAEFHQDNVQLCLYLRDVCCTAHLTQSATGTTMCTRASHQVISRDVLHNLTEDEREQIWAHRHKLVHVPEVCVGVSPARWHACVSSPRDLSPLLQTLEGGGTAVVLARARVRGARPKRIERWRVLSNRCRALLSGRTLIAFHFVGRISTTPIPHHPNPAQRVRLWLEASVPQPLRGCL